MQTHPEKITDMDLDDLVRYGNILDEIAQKGDKMSDAEKKAVHTMDQANQQYQLNEALKEQVKIRKD